MKCTGKSACKFFGLLIFGLTLIIVLPGTLIIAINPEFKINNTLYIGDSLRNTSGVHEASSSIGNVNMNFNIRIDSVYSMSRKPSTTIERLPETEIASNKNGYYQDYNYLGINQPIYLLAGSVINYKTTLQIKEPHNSFDNLACVILFNSLAKFDDFFRHGPHSGSQMQCFTNGNTSSVSWSFSIAEESQYYVGISIKSGVTVTSNVSIDRAYYNLSQTARNICTNSLSCNITVCSDILLCEKSYIIIKTKGITEVALLEYDISLRQWAIRASIVLLPLCSLALIIIVTSYIRCYKWHQDTKRRADDDNASVASSSLLEMETPFDDDDDHIELIPNSNQRQKRKKVTRKWQESDSFQHNSTASMPIPLSEELLQNATDTFDELTELQVGSNRTEYHSRQYGVTLNIPEGAVQESATVWFGACLFSDKFEFGNYVRVSPIVWVHSDRKLHKCAELYIPHDTVINTKDDLHKFTLLEFDALPNICTDKFKIGRHDKMKWGYRQLVKIECQYFHSYCIAVHKDLFDIVSKQYLMAIIEKKNDKEEVIVDFILICRQQGWKKIIAQCDQEGFKIVKYEPVSFKRGNEHEVSVPIEVQHSNNMTREYTAKIPVNIRDIELLDQLNEKIKFRDLPRFRIQFTHEGTVIRHKSPGNLNTVLLRSSPLKLDTGSTKKYTTMTEKFDSSLLNAVKEALTIKSIYDVKGCLLDLIKVEDWASEVEAVTDKASLEELLQRYCFLSNLSLLKCITEKLNLKELESRIDQLAEERDAFYSKVLAGDFAAAAIEDHEMIKEHHVEMTVAVSWSSSETTLAKFQDYITKEFKDLSMFIALRAVHHSWLTFVCTVPVWAIGAIGFAAFGLGYALHGIQQFRFNNEVIYEAPIESGRETSTHQQAMMRDLPNVAGRLEVMQHDRYRLAVTVLMDGNKVATQRKVFLQLFETLRNKLGSYALAVAFTIEVLKRSHWEDTESLRQFASSDYVLDSRVDLCLRVDDFYNTMHDDEFNSQKSFISMLYLDSRNVSDLNRSDFVLLLLREGIISPGDVSKIKGDSNFFDEYKCTNISVPTATVSSNKSSRSTTSTSMQVVSTSNTDNGKRSLGIKDVNMILTVLNEVLFNPTKWDDLGLKLGLYKPRLNVIEEGGGDAYRHLKKTIEAWLEGKDNVTSRTWQTLIDAVEGTGGRAAADEIPKKLKSLYNITL